MKYYLRVWIMVGAWSVPCGWAQMVSLPVEYRNQEASKWCWAACAEIIMDYMGHDVSQCELANNEFFFHNGDCCDHKTTPDCNQNAFPDYAFTENHFTFRRTVNKPLSWAAVKKQIQTKGKPFAFTWRWAGGGGHMMVAVGCGKVDGEKRIAYLDPINPAIGTDYKIMSFAEYKEDPDPEGDGKKYTHWDDFDL
jgi:hypothetical protein